MGVDHDALARDVSAAGTKLMAVVAAVHQAYLDAVLHRAAELRAAAAELAEAEGRLRDACLAHPAPFAKRRTRVVDGVKFGLRKAADQLLFDADKTAALAREHGVDVFAQRLDKAALGDLDGKTRRLLGVRRKKGRDNPVLQRLRDNLDDLRQVIAADLDAAAAE